MPGRSWIVLILATLLWATACGGSMYWLWPRARNTQTSFLVPEVAYKTSSVQVKIGDQVGVVSIDTPYTVTRPVYETSMFEPTREEQLRFALLGGMTCLLLLFFLLVIVSYGRCMLTLTPPPKSLEIQITATITFLTGALAGALLVPSTPTSQSPSLLGASNAHVAPPIPPPRHSAPGPAFGPPGDVGPPETVPPPNLSPN